MALIAGPIQCAWHIRVASRTNERHLEALVHHLPKAAFLRSEGVTAAHVADFHEMASGHYSDTLVFPEVDAYLEALHAELLELESAETAAV